METAPILSRFDAIDSTCWLDDSSSNPQTALKLLLRNKS
jgi:hypothetical protein